MDYTLTIRDDDFARLREIVFSVPGVEGAAFLLCGESRTDHEVRLLCRDVISVADEHYRIREPDLLSLESAAYVPVAKRARAEGLSVVFAHSHPGGLQDYSEQDDCEEAKLHEFLACRAPSRVHGSLVLTPGGVVGRVWATGFQPLQRIRVIGRRFTYFDRADDGDERLLFFDRQVLAFGHKIQALLGRLHIGVVGAGGTGSAVIEQLTRLGVGKLSVYDRDVFDPTNVNRVYGSCTTDDGRKKVDIQNEHIARIGLRTQVVPIPEHITTEEAARSLRDCDVVFGCTDKEAPRGILVQLMLRYLIPVFDIGVLVNSSGGVLREVVARVTVLLPGEACLFCRGRITAEGIRLEGLGDKEREARVAEGYAPELPTRSPAVVPFTTTASALGVSELLHRLTGYMGEERVSSEVLVFFDQSRMRTNRSSPGEDCLCNQRRVWGRGDSRRFLDLTWGR